MLVPFLSRSQQVMREFSLLAGISTVATSLDLLFVAVFSLGQFTSLTLALFLSLGAVCRRAPVDAQPADGQQHADHRAHVRAALPHRARGRGAAGDGTANGSRACCASCSSRWRCCTPRAAADARARGRRRLDAAGAAAATCSGGAEAAEPRGSLVLRFAHRGRRMFTREDARLTDRVVEQLKRAVAFDQAVEHGRNEERAAHRAGPARRHRRAAADADVQGADARDGRLPAPHPAGPEDADARPGGRDHLLSHAGGRVEGRPARSAWWRRTAGSTGRSRSTATSTLTVVQWSALTRVLRELVSNAIAHARPRGVDDRAASSNGGRLDAARSATTATAATRRPGHTASGWAACASASSSSAARWDGARTPTGASTAWCRFRNWSNSAPRLDACDAEACLPWASSSRGALPRSDLEVVDQTRVDPGAPPPAPPAARRAAGQAEVARAAAAPRSRATSRVRPASASRLGLQLRQVALACRTAPRPRAAACATSTTASARSASLR